MIAVHQRGSIAGSSAIAHQVPPEQARLHIEKAASPTTSATRAVGAGFSV
jgi:hypothetical protein